MIFALLIAGMFSLGLYGVLARRDIIGVLASVEVMLGSASVLLVGLGSTLAPASGSTPAAGSVQVIALLALVVAAAEAAVGLALLVSVARKLGTTRIDELTEVNG